MSLIRLVPLALACAACHAQDVDQAWHGERMTVLFRASAIGNLAWQLDTLSRHSNTQPKDYEDLWHNDLGWNAADARQLERWSGLYARHRATKTENRRSAARYPPNYARFYGTGAAREAAFKVAALNSADLEALAQRYKALCGGTCASDMLGVLRHFWPRFSGWWQQEGLLTAGKLLPQIVSKASESNLGALCESAIGLTNAQVPEHATVGLDLAVHPKKYLTNTSATVLDDHILIEVVDDPTIGAPPVQIAVHEFTHHFYDLAPRPDHVRLIDRFIARPEPWSMAAYSILNEVLAASVQLIAETRSRTPEDFATFVAKDDNVYFDPFISKVARATFPLIERRMTSHGNIFEGEFLEAYMKAASAALGPLLESPRFLLSSRVVIRWAEGKPAADEFNREVRGIVGQDKWRDFKASPNLGGMVFLTKNELHGLRKNEGVVPRTVLRELESTGQTHETFAYAWQRSPKAAVYFLYGLDAERLKSATTDFERSDRPFTGLSPAYR